MRGARLACVKPAASVRSEPGSNSQVEKTLIWLVSGHAFELTRTFTPRHRNALVDIILSKRVRQSLVWKHLIPGGMRVPRALCRPRFSFFNIQFSKNRQCETRCRGPDCFWLGARLSVAHAALLNFAEGRFRSELLRRQRRAALVGEAYIVGAPSNCQQRF